MDLQNIIIALQDQVIALEEKLTELTKLRETDIAIACERNNMLQQQISDLQRELKASKTMPFPMPEPSMPMTPAGPYMPAWPTTPFGSGMTVTAAADVDSSYATKFDANGVVVGYK